MPARNGRETLRLDEVEVRRTPGIPAGFRITGLSPGLNLIYGPNAAGKSTTARVIQGLFWPDSLHEVWPRAAFGGVLHVAAAEWRIAYDAGHPTCQRDGVDTDPLRVAVPAEHRDRYLLSLHDLLRAENAGGPLADVILRESAGGYDVPEAMRTLGYRSARSREGRPQALIDRVRAAQQAVRRTRDGYDQLRRDEERLDDLRERQRAAIAAAEQVALLQRAREHAAARRALDQARERLARFPEVLKHLHGDEAEHLERIDAGLAEARERRMAATMSLERARETEVGTGLADVPLPPGTIERLRRLHADLKDLAAEIRHAERAHQAALELREEARRRIAPDLTDEQVAALDREGLQAYVEATDALARVLAAEQAERELQAWLGDAAPVEDLHRLQQGITLLSQWLKTPATHDSGEAMQRPAGMVAAVLVAAEGVALGLLVHPALWVLALAGVALLVVILRRPAVPDAAAIAANTQREFLRLDLGGPAAWEAEEVEKLLASLIVRLQAAVLEQERAQRWAGLSDRRATLAAGRDQAEARRAAVRQRFGLSVEGDVTRLTLLASNVAAWQRAADEAAAQATAAESARSSYQQALNTLNEELARFGYPEAGEPAGIAGHLEDLATRAEQLREARDQAERDRQALEDAEREIERLEVERRALLEPLGLTPDDTRPLYQWLEMLSDYRDAVTAVERAEGALATAASALANHPDLLDVDEVALAQEIHAHQRRADELDAITREIGDIEGRIRGARQTQDLERALAEQDDALDALRAARERDFGLAAGWVLGEFVQERTRDGARPRVFHRARELFARITQERYRLEFQDGPTPAFRATDNVTGTGHSLEELSSATRVQLLLAVRLAFIEEAEQGPCLPLLLDETLGNSDEQRARAIIDATVEICRGGRQVFYFTAQHDEVAKWRAILRDHPDVPHAVHDLTEIRGLADYERLPLPDPTPPPPAVPAPGDMTRDEYGRVLRVPGIDPSADGIGGVHLWHLVADLAALHRLLSHGIVTWGQAESLASRGAFDTLVGDPAVYPRAAARACVLAAALDAYRIGRGRPVDRAVLLDSGAVSDIFIDQVTDLAQAQGGDARRLVTALRAREVPGFQRRKIEELEGFLIEHGYLDERDPLSPEQIRLEALTAGKIDLEAGHLSAADIDELLTRLLREPDERP